ncbi:hypothetical protein ABPG72_020678 [Tetrahymena utriculariae]
MNSLFLEATEEERQTQNCKIHKGCPLIFYEIQQRATNNPIVCAKCVTQNDLKGRNLMIIEEILNCNDNSVFQNWPTTEDKSILAEYKSILEQADLKKYPIAILDQYFDSLQQKIIEKITQCKKKIYIDIDNIFITKDGIKNVYNSVSQKNYFRELTQNFKNGEEESVIKIQQLIQEINSKCKENSQTLTKAYNFYKNSEYALQLQIPNLYTEEMINIINQLQDWFLKGFQGDSSAQFQRKKYDYNDTIREILSLVNNPTNFCKDSFLKKLEICLQIVGPALPRLEPNSYLKEGKEKLDFTVLLEEQFQIYEKSIRNIMNIENQIKKISEDKVKNSEIFENVDILQKEIQSNLKQFYFLSQRQFTEIKQKNKFEIDLTYKCLFQKSKQDGFSQSHQKIERSSQNILEITTKDSGWNVQSHYDTLINPFTKYWIVIQLEPYSSFNQSYEFNIGIQKEKSCNNQWVSSSPYFFSNTSDCKFEHAAKGLAFCNTQIKHDKKMRQLEFQMCIAEKHFLIADYPEYSNVTVATEEQLSDLDSSKNYKLGIEIKSIQKVKILKFLEVSSFPTV